jgi:Rrf2 family protein
MKIPAKIEYTYKAIFELALRYEKVGPVQLSAISEAQGIPKKFLIQLLLRLKSANIVDSARGTAGGYYLTRPPSRISLAAVTKAIDDSIIEAPKEARGSKPSEVDKVISHIWGDIAKYAARRLEGITFDKLISQINNQQLTYQI